MTLIRRSVLQKLILALYSIILKYIYEKIFTYAIKYVYIKPTIR
jgi:hypothetical protein